MTARRGTALRRSLAVLAGALLVLLAPLATALPAQAHDRLESSSPADGSVVDVAPTSVVLTLSAPALALGTQVVVTGPGGAVVSTGDPQLVDDTVTQQLAGDLPAGQYRVEWRVTSSDGHPVSGSLAYTASAGAQGGASESPSATGPATPSATPSASASAAGSDAAPVAASSGGGSGGLPTGAAVAVLAVLAGLAAAVVVVVRRRR